MGIIRIEDIAGYNFDGGFVCAECVTDEEDWNAKESQIITRDEADGESRYSCVRCEKRVA